MIYKLVGLIIILTISVGAVSYIPENEAITAIEEKLLLEAELDLSKSPDAYCIINLREKKIQMKVRGVVLKQWDVENLRFWGNPIPLTPLPLAQKSALRKPVRENITPNGKEEKKDAPVDKIQAFEVGSMPSNYTLIVGGGIKISIRTKPEARFFTKLANVGLNIKWYTAPPLRTLWGKYKKLKPFTLVDMVLDKKDAQALYWTFTEGAQCIIIPPRDFLMLLDFDATID